MLRPVGPGGQQRYICVDCGKHYTTSYNVRMHRNIHLGKNLYNCKFCHKEFSHKHVWEVSAEKRDFLYFLISNLLSRLMSEFIQERGPSNVPLAPRTLLTEVTTTLTRKYAFGCSSRPLEPLKLQQDEVL